jgi:hypothetical protein
MQISEAEAAPSPPPQRHNPKSNTSIVMSTTPNNHRKELAFHLTTCKEIIIEAQFNFCADPHSFAWAV